MSDTKKYDEGMSKNKERFASAYAKKGYLSFGGKRKREEDWAETISMAAFRDVPDKTNAKIRYSDGTIVDYDQFVSDHQGTFQIACDFLDGKIDYDTVTRL